MSTVEERSLVKLNVEADVATIVLNRPDVRNALNRQLMIDLIDVAQSVSDREDIRAVLLTSEGQDFSVGADLKEVAGMQPGKPSSSRTLASPGGGLPSQRTPL